MIMGPISIVFCGHLGSTEELDGAALALSVSDPLSITIFEVIFMLVLIEKILDYFLPLETCSNSVMLKHRARNKAQS